MVSRCVCFDVSFEEMKQIIDRTGARNLDELRAHIEFGQKCELCVPYVKKVCETGETSFEIVWEE